MAKTRLSEAQVKKILQEVGNGAKPTDLAKKHGFSLGSFYNWKSRFGIPKAGGSAPASAPAAKKAAPKKATAKKATAKKAGRPGRPAKKRAGRPAAKKVAAPRASTSATAIVSKINGLKAQIAKIEGQIEGLKLDYANAMLSK